MAKSHIVGPTRYCGEALIKRKGYYHDGSLALQAYSDAGPAYTATVCIHTPPAEGCVWIKNWSENEGVFNALVEAGIIEPTGRVEHSGFVAVPEGRLLVDF